MAVMTSQTMTVVALLLVCGARHNSAGPVLPTQPDGNDVMTDDVRDTNTNIDDVKMSPNDFNENSNDLNKSERSKVTGQAVKSQGSKGRPRGSVATMYWPVIGPWQQYHAPGHAPVIRRPNAPRVRCSITTSENLHNFIDIMETEELTKMFEFEFSFDNYTLSPFNDTGRYFKPWLWYTTRSRHGRTLLMLSFHYDVLSMSILTIGVKKVPVTLSDTPLGCFGELDNREQMTLIRQLLLSRNDVGTKSVYGKSAREEFACNQEVAASGGFAEFVYNCCHKDAEGHVICSTDDDDLWISILYMCITIVKLLSNIMKLLTVVCVAVCASAMTLLPADAAWWGNSNRIKAYRRSIRAAIQA